MVAKQINLDVKMQIDLLLWFLTVLYKNLVLLQENTIDVEDSLEKIWKTKEKKLSLWEKIVKFLKELFNIR